MTDFSSEPMEPEDGEVIYSKFWNKNKLSTKNSIFSNAVL